MFVNLHYDDGRKVCINMDHIRDFRLVHSLDGFGDDLVNKLTIMHGEGSDWYLVKETPEDICRMVGVPNNINLLDEAIKKTIEKSNRCSMEEYRCRH